MKLYIDTKPELVWTGGMHESPWYAETDTGFYSIFQHPEKLLTYNDQTTKNLGHKLTRIGKYKTVDKAKQAAQADYERRTAERFKVVEVPPMTDYANTDIQLARGWNAAIEKLHANITKAKERG